MKSLLLITICLTMSLSAQARCIVEIFSSSGDPLGHMFQESNCSAAMTKCQSKLSSINQLGARCEITLDIPGGRLPDEIE